MRLALVLAATCAAAGCSALVSETDAYDRVDIPSHPPVELRVRLGPSHTLQAARYVAAARATLTAYANRFGVMPFTSLTVTDAWSPSLANTKWSGGGVVVASGPWLAPRRAMEPELAVSRAVGAQYWRKALSCDADAGWFIDGVTQYTATPVVASLFEVQQAPPAFSYLEGRYFHGFVPFVVRVPLKSATAGNGLDDYRASPGVDVRKATGDRRVAAAKTALAMGTLERWVGAPTWDAVLQEFASRRWPRCPAPADLERVAQEVTGLDLAWFFEPVFNSTHVFDYGVENLTSAPDAGGGAVWKTTVTVRRYGDGEFTGSSAPRSGAFESGRGMQVRVVFEDGSERVDSWDGRDATRTFLYESAGPVRSATVDPGDVLLLDTNRTNNSRMRQPEGRRAATKWAARWAIWLQDLLLTYASLT